MKLRKHQEKAVQMLRDSFASGHRTPMLAAPCGFGKTVVAAWILKQVQDRGQRGIFICDRLALLDQTINTFKRAGIVYGVIQSEHWETNPEAPIQIASVQTLMRRRWKPHFDLGIVDEAHVMYKGLIDMVQSYNLIKFIGMSGTPMTPGLGKVYDDLLVPATPRELLAKGYLCPVDYYAGIKPDISSVKAKYTSRGSDYDAKQLAWAIEKDQVLAGDIVENYIRHAADTKAISFSPSVLHSKTLVDKFQAAGIKAYHIDGYMSQEERGYIYRSHRDNGGVLSCSRLLGIGFDDPTIQTEICAYPTMSLSVWVQRCARIWRTHESKERGIFLDHSGNLERFQTFPEDVIPMALHDGSERYKEKKLVKKEKTGKIRECPQCFQEFMGLRCQCGFEVKVPTELLCDGQVLEKCEDPKRVKQRWMAELLFYARVKDYSPGWATKVYKEKFKEFPVNIKHEAHLVSKDVQGYIKHRNIKYAARKHRQAIG